ncbi:serine protease easter-like isoform X2 [Zophobas morio]|uniref:serine protease easter-like isoform X2 n=1 Tax=Zophobas morio TaxID=2755281 RepID=UPI0030839537
MFTQWCIAIPFVLHFALSEFCGLHTESKISSGGEATIGQFPWLALLESKRRNGSKYFNCGGVLISKRYVLTGAGCVTKRLTGVRLGEHDTATDPDCVKTAFRDDCAPPPIDIPVEDTVVHEGFDKANPNLYDNIALLRLKQEVTINDYIMPICLPTEDGELSKSYVGERLAVSGWGFTENMANSVVKLKGQLPGRNHSYCEDMYRKHNFNLTLKDSQLCAGGERGNDSCKGNAGAPLMVLRPGQHGSQWYVVGLFSFGPQPCNMENWGDVYTRVSKYVTWIKSKLRS